MSISGLFQFIIGFILGVLLLALGSAGAAYYFFTKMAALPAKPVFSEEQAKPQTEASTETPSADSTESNKTQTEETPKPQPTSEPSKKLEPGTYRAKVTWPEGLSLRQEASINAERIGGVGYNWEIIVLKDSDNKQWQKIRIPDSEQEGWIKAGNIKKIEAEEE